MDPATLLPPTRREHELLTDMARSAPFIWMLIALTFALVSTMFISSLVFMPATDAQVHDLTHDVAQLMQMVRDLNTTLCSSLR